MVLASRASAETSGSSSTTSPRTPTSTAASGSSSPRHDHLEPRSHRPRHQKPKQAGRVWGFEEFMAMGKDKFGKRSDDQDRESP
jgi:hypothetical protein